MFHINRFLFILKPGGFIMKIYTVLMTLLAMMLLSVQVMFGQTTNRTNPHSSHKQEKMSDNSRQDPTVVDAMHYQVIFENDQVRVLRINYGPYEKSVMHYHPEGVAVFMN
ncbi:MAG: hypothetical protein D6748_06625, partial [Calditrichaeota bacterium]